MAQDRPATLVTGPASERMERRASSILMERSVTVDDATETIFSRITSNPFVTAESIVIDGGYAATS